MATLVYALNVSLDGYVDHQHFAPDPVLYRHWIDRARQGAGSLCGRRTYELMRYWEEDQPDWDDADRAFAEAWRAQPKWVVSRTLDAVGPNATRIEGDLGEAVRGLKDRIDGEVDVSGPQLAQALADLGLIDEVRLYLHPVVLGGGTPFFARPWPRLRPTGSERIGPDVIRLDYVPA